MLNINNMSGYNDDAIYSEVADNAFELKKNDAIYSEVTDKAFELKKNRCYSDVQILSLNKTKPTGKINGNKCSATSRCVVVISLCVFLMILMLAATSAGFAYAILEIFEIKSDTAENNVITSHDHNSEQLTEVRQNFSQLNFEVQELRDRHDRHAEELIELRQNFSHFDSEGEELRANYTDELTILKQNISQLNLEVEELRTEHDHNTEQLFELRQNLSQLQHDLQQLRAEVDVHCPILISSCSSLPPSCPSGNYFHRPRTSNGSAIPVYCDTTLSCGNITGGWMRVAELNMTDTSQLCPGELVERNEAGIRHCRIPSSECYSVHYPMHMGDVSYSRICGRITAYQVGSTNGFLNYYLYNLTASIDSNYLTGVSLTQGTPRQHIWTFAAALDKTGNAQSGKHCPCQFNSRVPPPFVREDYFCDAGNEEFMTGEFVLQIDPLWDGTNCLCCDNPPWFYKQLPQPTTDDIEMRVCKKEDSENIGITEVEIYVQ